MNQKRRMPLSNTKINQFRSVSIQIPQKKEELRLENA